MSNDHQSSITSGQGSSTIGKLTAAGVTNTHLVILDIIGSQSLYVWPANSSEDNQLLVVLEE